MTVMPMVTAGSTSMTSSPEPLRMAKPSASASVSTRRPRLSPCSSNTSTTSFPSSTVTRTWSLPSVPTRIERSPSVTRSTGDGGSGTWGSSSLSSTVTTVPGAAPESACSNPVATPATNSAQPSTRLRPAARSMS